MMEQILIIGGQGRVGHRAAMDVLLHTQAQITITGRTLKSGNDFDQRVADRIQFLTLDLSDQAGLEEAIARSRLVIHGTGSFQQRDARVLRFCIANQVHYIDVSDDREFTRTAFSYRLAPQSAGITAVINTGFSPVFLPAWLGRQSSS